MQLLRVSSPNSDKEQADAQPARVGIVRLNSRGARDFRVAGRPRQFLFEYRGAAVPGRRHPSALSTNRDFVPCHVLLRDALVELVKGVQA